MFDRGDWSVWGLWFLMPLSKLFMDTERYLNILNSGLIIRALSFLFVCTLYGHFLLANVFEPRLTQRSQLNRVFFLLFLEHGCTSHLSSLWTECSWAMEAAWENVCKQHPRNCNSRKGLLNPFTSSVDLGVSAEVDRLSSIQEALDFIFRVIHPYTHSKETQTRKQTPAVALGELIQRILNVCVNYIRRFPYEQWLR